MECLPGIINQFNGTWESERDTDILNQRAGMGPFGSRIVCGPVAHLVLSNTFQSICECNLEEKLMSVATTAFENLGTFFQIWTPAYPITEQFHPRYIHNRNANICLQKARTRIFLVALFIVKKLERIQIPSNGSTRERSCRNEQIFQSPHLPETSNTLFPLAHVCMHVCTYLCRFRSVYICDCVCVCLCTRTCRLAANLKCHPQEGHSISFMG